MSSPPRFRATVPVEVVTVRTVERALVLAERRIRARTATRAEWRAYRHLIRVSYSQPRHRNAHRRRAQQEALVALRSAMVSAIIRSTMRRVTVANSPLAAYALAMALELVRHAFERFFRLAAVRSTLVRGMGD